MTDALGERGVNVEILATEIEALRQAALWYARIAAENPNAAGGAWLDVETAAIRFVRKLDDETHKARSPDYLAIVQQAERDREKSGN